MKRILFTFALSVLCTAVWGRAYRGRVFTEGNMPVEFANIVLLKSDSTFVNGVVSDKNGSFEIPSSSEAAHLIKISSTGYKTIYKELVSSEDLGTILLPVASNVLNEVVVKGNLPTYALKGTSLVTNVAGSMLSQLGTAEDVLKHVPGILKDGDDFKVFGKGVAVIYVNGRILQDQTELSRLNASDIASVELITNPGAEYDASVKAILKIKTLKKQGEGWGVSLRSYLHQAHSFSTNDQLTVNYRKNGLELFSTFSYNNWKQMQNQTNLTKILASDTIWKTDDKEKICWTSKSSYNKSGFNYNINDNQSFGATYSCTYAPESEVRMPMSSTVDVNDKQYDLLTYDTKWYDRNSPTNLVNAYYAGEFGKWSIHLDNDFLSSSSSKRQNTQELSTTHDNRLVTSTNHAHNSMVASKLVAGRDLNKAKLSGGMEYVYTNRTENYINPQNYLPQSDDHIRENKVAGFMSGNYSIGKALFEAGLRYEHCVSNYYEYGAFVPEQSRNYNSFFPNFSISFPVKNVSFAVSYTAKTRRPSYRELSSNLQYDEHFLYEGGNPKLQPETNHDLSLQVGYKWIQFSGTYQYVTNAIVDQAIQYDKNPSVSIFTMTNYDHLSNYDARLSLSPIIGLWHPNLTMDVNGESLTVNFMNKPKKMDNPLGYFGLNNAFELNKSCSLNVDLSYQTGGNGSGYGCVKAKPFGQVNLSFYKSFLKDKFSLNVECNDLFKTGRQSFTTYSSATYFDKWCYSDSRNVCLTLKYNFNITKSKYKGTGAGGDEMNRF
jgi:hypothetical protein